MSTVYGFLRSGKWAAATIVVVGLAILFVNLGLWQLRRHDERRLENQVMSARLESPPQELGLLLDAVGDDVASLEFRPAVVTGTFLPEHERLTRNQTNRGVAGFHVLTPLELPSGELVIVNRGWVPLEMDTPPVAASPPSGEVTVDGVLRTSQQRASVGPVDQPGSLVLSRVDLNHLEGEIGVPLAPVWLQAAGPEDVLPVPVPVEDFDDPGSHFSYAIQWFAFALIAVVGYVSLIRSTGRRGSTRERVPV